MEPKHQRAKQKGAPPSKKQDPSRGFQGPTSLLDSQAGDKCILSRWESSPLGSAGRTMNCRRCEGWEVQVPREAWLSGKWRARAQARPRAGGALTPPSCPRNHLLPPKRGQKSQSTGLAHSPHSPSSPSTQSPAWHPYLDRCPGTQGTPILAAPKGLRGWEQPRSSEGLDPSAS